MKNLEEKNGIVYQEILKRLAYGVRVVLKGEDKPRYASEFDIIHNTQLLDGIKLYLRDMVDMKESEKDDIKRILMDSNDKLFYNDCEVNSLAIRRDHENNGKFVSFAYDSISYSTMAKIVDYLYSKQFLFHGDKLPYESVQGYITTEDGNENLL